jgi:hypothetical protein
MKFKFTLENKKTHSTENYRTLQEIAEVLNITYHQSWEFSKVEEKQYSHPFLKNLSKTYKISKYVQK